MPRFLKQLDENYAFWNRFRKSFLTFESVQGRREHLSEVIFEFITPDYECSWHFATKMLDVCSAILNGNTHEYKKKYGDNFYLMINMPFLRDKIQFGGASPGYWKFTNRAYKLDCDRIDIGAGELSEFIGDIIEWSRCD